MPLIVGGVLVLLMTITLFYFLFSAKETYSSASSDLRQEESRLVRLSDRVVFPSESNVRILGKQLNIYQEYLDGLFGAMSEGQFKAVQISRAQFPLVLEKVLRRLVNKARAQTVTLPPSFSFGFKHYTEGNLPAEEDVERLGIQLRSIASLVDILYEAGIGELSSVERTMFERDAQIEAPLNDRATRRGTRHSRTQEPKETVSTEVYTDPDGLFTREHYVLSYRAQDEANWAILDRMAKGAPFIVVTKMEIMNSARPVVALPAKVEEEKAPAQAVSASGWKAAAPLEGVSQRKQEEVNLPRELRVVAGQELPNIRLEVDLYRFAQAETAETAETAVENGEENP